MKSLEVARFAITKEDWKSALASLLEAWRKKRVARIADLIDRVAERLPSDPIKAKTVKARHAAWLELSAALDHADLGRLLATPFPGRWQDAMPVITRLGEFRDDPRIAVALARFVATEPYDTVLQARPLFKAATDILARQYDSRASTILEEHSKRAHGFYWQYRGGDEVESAIARMNEMPADVLEANEEAALTAVEALFSSEIIADTTAKRSEADFMAAIYAAPNDDTPRAVFADWLTEQGDPRGEFIASQLAPNPSDQSKKREATLLKKYGAEWAGHFHHLFSEAGRSFRRGFLAVGTLGGDGRRPTSEDLARPEWALLENVYFAHDIVHDQRDDLLTMPWLATLRGMRGLDVATTALLAKKGLASQLEELGIDLRRSTTDTAASLEAIARGFPNVKTLGLYASTDDLARALAGPLPPKCECLRVQNPEYPLAVVARAVEAHLPKVTLVEIDHPHLREDGEWHFELRRDANGTFTKLRARTRNPSRQLPDAGTFSAVVASMPALTELVVERSGGCKWNPKDIALAEEAIARATALHVVEVPWDRAVGAAPNDETNHPRLDITLYRPGDLSREIDTVWEALAARSLSFDSMTINDGAHKPIHGPEDAKNAFTKKRTRKVRVYAKRAPAMVQASFESWAFRLTMPRPDDLDAWLAWLVAFVDRTDAQSLDVPFYGRDDDGNIVALTERTLGPRRETFRWLWSIGPLKEPFYDVGALEAAFLETIPKTRVVRTKQRSIFRLGDTPESVPSDAEHAALDARVSDIFWQRFERTQGYTVPKLLTEILAPPLEARGYVPAGNGAWRRADGAGVVVHTDVVRTEIGLRAELESDGSSRWETVTRERATTADMARAALTDFVSRLDGIPWLK